MSRVFGRAYDVFQVSNLLNEAKLPRYKKDYRECSWDDIETTPERIELYLPDRAIEFLSSKKVKIMKTPFLKYTLTQIPDTDEEDRFIKFPSLLPKEEFKRELLFYLGMLLSSYREDEQDEDYGIPGEYEDTLPLLLEYLYLKVANRQDEFSLKHLNQLRMFNKTYPTFYKDYQDFENLRKDAVFANLDKTRTEKFKKLCIEKDDEITSLTKDSVVQLSSFEGALSLIDITKTRSDMKQLIEELMLNEQHNRRQVLADRNIDSYGYRRIRQEIDKYDKRTKEEKQKALRKIK